MGVLLEPIMRPVFGVPGCGAFVLAMGYTSGAPIGSILTARLRSQQMCSRNEAERLMSFTNNASPLFMFVAVSVGMFRNPALGVVIAGSHYSANLLLGVILRLYSMGNATATNNSPGKSNLLINALRALFHAQRQDGRPLGKLLSDAIKTSVTTLTTIGGFIILFSVIIEIAEQIGLIYILSRFILLLLQPLGFNAALAKAVASGSLEMTLGAKMVSEATAPLPQKIAAVSMILGWSGLSIHAQVASMISGTDIQLTPYVITRLLHGILAAVLSQVLFRPVQSVFALTVPHWQQQFTSSPNLFQYWLLNLIMLASVLLLLFTLTAIQRFIRVLLNVNTINRLR